MNRSTARLVVALLLAAGAGSCAFGARLPPGSAGGTFFDEPEGAPALSSSMAGRQRALEAATRARMREQLVVLKELVRSSGALRAELALRATQVAERVARRGEVGPLEVELVRESARWVLELDAVLYGMWTSYRAYLPYGSEPDPYAPGRGASLLSSSTRAKGGLIALAAELARLDNAAAVVAVLADQVAVTQVLNRGDPDRGIPPESYDRLVGSLYDPDHRALLRAQLVAAAAARDRLDAAARDDEELAWLLAVVGQSGVARTLLDEGAVARQARFAGAVIERSALGLASPVLEAWAAARWGPPDDTAAAPTPLQASPAVADALLAALQPLDVVVVRDLRRGDAARGHVQALVHLGDYRSLLSSSAAKHPAMALHAAELRRGRTFLVVGKTGPQLVDLDDVLLAEDAAILRVVDDARTDEALQRALDVLLDPSFLDPPALDEDEHAARLLGRLLGLDEGARPGAPPRLADLLTASVLGAAFEDVPFATLDGAIAEPGARRTAAQALVEKMDAAR